MKPVDISGTKRRNIWKLKLMNLKLTARSKISETCTGASISLRRVILLQTPTVFCLVEEPFLSANDIRQTEIHTAEPLVPEPSASDVEMATGKLNTNHQVLIKSQQNWLKQGVEQFALRSINLWIMFIIRRNCLRNGRSWSLYLFKRRVIKQIVVIIEACHFCQ